MAGSGRRLSPPHRTSSRRGSACLPWPEPSRGPQDALPFPTFATRPAPRPLTVEIGHNRPTLEYFSFRIGHTRSIVALDSGNPPRPTPCGLLLYAAYHP